MNLYDFRLAILYLIEGGLVAPFNHGFWDIAQDNFNPALSEDHWSEYQWNPPQPFIEINRGVEYQHCAEYVGMVDADASPKPTWADLTQALTDITLINARSTRIQRVTIEETRSESVNNTWRGNSDLTNRQRFSLKYYTG